MKISPPQAILAISLALAATASAEFTDRPVRLSSGDLNEFANRMTGVIFNSTGRGSGTVTTNPQVATTAGHVSYEDGPTTGGYWMRCGHHDATFPTLKATKLLRGRIGIAGYDNGTGSGSFSNDFAVHFAYTHLAGGSHFDYLQNDNPNYHPLTLGGPKLILGYPGNDGWWQNRVGIFTSRYTPETEHFMWCDYVSGYSGMSGGGVFAETGGRWKLVGVHVAGNKLEEDGTREEGAGVRAFDLLAARMIGFGAWNAKSKVGRPSLKKTTFRTDPGMPIPDATNATGATPGSSAWTSVPLTVADGPESIFEAVVSFSITHPARGQLEVQLISPSGRILMLHDNKGAKKNNLNLKRNVSAAFRGETSTGTWKLDLRDTVTGEKGKADWFSLWFSGL